MSRQDLLACLPPAVEVAPSGGGWACPSGQVLYHRRHLYARICALGTELGFGCQALRPILLAADDGREYRAEIAALARKRGVTRQRDRPDPRAFSWLASRYGLLHSVAWPPDCGWRGCPGIHVWRDAERDLVIVEHGESRLEMPRDYDARTVAGRVRFAMRVEPWAMRLHVDAEVHP